MKTYYAVCNANGPISRRIEADDIAGAVAAFEAADLHAWVNEGATDAEDDIGLDGTGSSESEFAELLESAGCIMVQDLDLVVCGQGPTLRADHLLGGWQLWQAPE